MGTLVITGVSGFLGQALLQSLDQDPQRPARVVGIDIRFPTYSPPWLVFYSHDVREEVLAARLKREQAEQLVHLANPQVPMRDERLRRQIVVGGAKNILSACAQAGVRHLLMLSSAVVYGPKEETDAVVTEDSPLRGHPRFGYARDMIRVQLLAEEFAERHPETTVTG